MTSLFIGLYGIYFLLVGAHSNTAPLITQLQGDVPKYLPWLLAIIVIAFLSQYETTEKIVKPFVALLILNFFLKNFGTIKSQVTGIYAQAAQGVQNG